MLLHLSKPKAMINFFTTCCENICNPCRFTCPGVVSQLVALDKLLSICCECVCNAYFKLFCDYILLPKPQAKTTMENSHLVCIIWHLFIRKLEAILLVSSSVKSNNPTLWFHTQIVGNTSKHTATSGLTLSFLKTPNIIFSTNFTKQSHIKWKSQFQLSQSHEVCPV